MYKKPGIWTFMKFSFKNLNLFKSVKIRDPIRSKLTLANMEIAKLGYSDRIYIKRVEEFNQGMIELYKGKWYATKAMQTKSKDDWKKSFAGFKNAKKMGNNLYNLLKSGATESIEYEKSRITSNGTEIKFADDVPLVPEITPVIILQGSDYDMDYQYAQQLVQIFGKWILERKAGRNFSESEKEVMHKWEEQHKKHTPEILEFCRGWVKGAIDAGVKMSYEDVLNLWVGHKPPATSYLDSEAGIPDMLPLACSGVAAWGRATKDGKLVTGSTGDHDLSYQVTVVVFPKTGNNFIYSPFGAMGDIAGAGDIWFFGHPAMNSKGISYVHHGGGPKFLEPKKYWGYGIRRMASVMHILRFCDSTKDARRMETSWPIGDIGLGDQATVGGFYADSNYGYVIEGRKEPVAIRETGLMGETDFLYANNSAIHPDAIKCEWMETDKDEWMWDEHGGWRPKIPVGMTKSLGMFIAWFSGRLSTSDILRKGMMFAYTNSCNRNKYMFNMMNRALGHVDFEYMKMIYRNSGTIPEGPWKKITKNYVKKGEWGEISTGHASNAMTVVTKPSEGIYALCTGPAKRGLAPMMLSSAISIYSETNAFWEIKLASNPEGVARYAKRKAEEFIKNASGKFAKLKRSDVAYKALEELLNLAEIELKNGMAIQKNQGNQIYDIAKATRAFTRAQVRALQVYQALVPPPDKTEDF